ncbi:hypothetical protein FACS1894111_09820 [Clostridia bacterium]|nr:hypothetical protein FACS1894111_09820 [Clostridia bacterium]
MTYETFKKSVVKTLRSRFSPDTAITIHTIPRNNGNTADGLTILEAGKNIAPTLYLNEYYPSLQGGESFSALCSRLFSDYHKYRPAENIDASFFCDFGNVKERIVYRLIHRKRNIALLKTLPYIPFLDLAIVFYCLVSTGESGNATILVTNPHLSLWQTDKVELLRLAKRNSPFLLSCCCNELSDFLGKSISETGEDGRLLRNADTTSDVPDGSISETDKELPTFPLSDSIPSPMYLLTNESRLYGAACILYQDLLSDLADRLSCDLYILPCSVHEVLLLPAREDCTKEHLNAMILDINTKQLEEGEILSDHAYYYSRKDSKLGAA